MSISTEQCVAIEKELLGWFADVRFEYDGHEIRVQKVPLRENVLRLVVFIDGKIEARKGVDLDDTGFDPLVVLFWRRSERYAFGRKHRESMIRYNKLMKRSKLKGTLYDPDKKLVTYHPDFSTAKSLVRQFRKVEGLTLVEEEK